MSDRASVLKPQDIVVVCQLAVWNGEPPVYTALVESLRISRGEIFHGLKRAKRAKLISKAEPTGEVQKQNLYDFLVHGLPTVFFPNKTEVVRGVPTSIYAPLFRSRFVEGRGDEIQVVWPYSKGKATGEGLVPLYPSVPLIAQTNDVLYNVFSAIDVLRIGKQREKDAAMSVLSAILGLDDDAKEGV